MAEKYIKKLLSARYIAIVLFILFIIWQIALIIHYEGWYAFDELYHISSANPVFDAVYTYNRAPYINGCIRFLSSHLGCSYYVYKLIPFILSLISMGILLFLTYKLTIHRYSLVISAILMTTHSILVYNHLYIRMYVWDEAIMAILALLLYILSQIHSIFAKIILHCIYFFTAGLLYWFQTGEESSLAVLATAVAAWFINSLGRHFLTLIQKMHWEKKMMFLVFCLYLICTFFICICKLGIMALPDFMNRVSGHILGALDFPCFSFYFLTKGILFTIALIVFGYNLLKGKNTNGILGIYALAFIPYLTYNMIFFDQHIFRAYSSFLPLVILITTLWLDSFSSQKRSYLLIAFFTSFTVIASYPDWNLRQFFQDPDIPYESSFQNYGEFIAQMEMEIANGRKCIAIWTNEIEPAAFSVNATQNFVFLDSRNHDIPHSDEETTALLDFILTTDESYIVTLSPFAYGLMHKALPGFPYLLENTYPYTKYQRDAYLFYVDN